MTERIAELAYIALSKFRHTLRYLNIKRKESKALAEIKKKSKIKVVFVLFDLAKWKTENLYLEMMQHERFLPTICVTLKPQSNAGAASTIRQYENLTGYLAKMGYKYIDAPSIGSIEADIIFYQTPYLDDYPQGFSTLHHHRIICYVPYCFTNSISSRMVNTPIMHNASMVFVENDITYSEIRNTMHRNSKALMVTGLPFGDMLAKDKFCFCNPWRTQSTNKKKIIWAPHFTVKEGITWNVLSVFLDIHKFMVQLAQKYKEHIQIAFKPHPQLRGTLESIWGKAETDSYYKLWETMDNTQLEEGEYLGLMKYSDAMIHDCGSFLIEYLYIDKPVLCTIPENQVRKTMNKFSNMAYDCACHGASIKDIENFVDDIIADKDAQRSRRKQFIDNYLCTKSPNQSCCNIINKILS